MDFSQMQMKARTAVRRTLIVLVWAHGETGVAAVAKIHSKTWAFP
jgi:hypothetical protein